MVGARAAGIGKLLVSCAKLICFAIVIRAWNSVSEIRLTCIALIKD